MHVLLDQEVGVVQVFDDKVVALLVDVEDDGLDGRIDLDQDPCSATSSLPSGPGRMNTGSSMGWAMPWAGWLTANCLDHLFGRRCAVCRCVRVRRRKQDLRHGDWLWLSCGGTRFCLAFSPPFLGPSSGIPWLSRRSHKVPPAANPPSQKQVQGHGVPVYEQIAQSQQVRST